MVILSPALRIGVSAIQMASNSKKGKAKTILTECRSVLSGHKELRIRPRLSDDKVEFIAWDPWAQRLALYKEHKKVKSVREDKHSREVDIVAKIHERNDNIFDAEDALRRPFFHSKS